MFDRIYRWIVPRACAMKNEYILYFICSTLHKILIALAKNGISVDTSAILSYEDWCKKRNETDTIHLHKTICAMEKAHKRMV